MYKDKNILGLLICLLLGIIVSACQKAPELTITSPTSVELSADGSSSTITFTANRDWRVSSSESWVTVSPSSGTASESAVTVTVRCNANTTYDDRTATVTINMEELSKTVTVRQPANLGVVLPKQVFDLQSDAKSIDVEVQANVQYTVSTSVNWIKQTGTKGLASKTLTFSIEENKTYDPREGKITIKPQDSSVQEQVISVKQAQKDAIIVEKTSYDMPYGGGEIEIKVDANVDFDVTPNADWIHYTQTKALSSSTVCLKIDENATFSSRQGTVEIKQKNGSMKHTITVNQAGMIAVSSVELDNSTLALQPGGSATLTATVKPDNATNKTVSWSTSDSSIATVDDAGKVTAIKEGSATITAKAGEKTAECKVTVYIAVISVTLNKTSISLVEGNTIGLIATIEPNNATNKTVQWSSSDSSIASVDDNGLVTAIKEGSATINAIVGEKKANCSITVLKAPDIKTVDLGIIMTREDGSTYNLLWAECNIGANAPEEYGDYYAWGEIETKENYSWDTYLWGETGLRVTKYYLYNEFITPTYWAGEGAPDGKVILDPEDDVAHMKYGGNWRIPNVDEIEALVIQCNGKWTTRNGVNGYEFTSKVNSNSIFLPAAGYKSETTLREAGDSGNYRLRNVGEDYLTPVFFFTSSSMNHAGGSRSAGIPVRPVTE